MSNTLALNCWVLGDGPNHIFTVEIASAMAVGHLKDVIKDEKKNRFHDLDAADLELWQVSDRCLRPDANDLILWKVNIDSKDLHLLDTIRDEDIKARGGVALEPMSRLSTVFTDGLEDEHLHIVVRHPAVGSGECNLTSY